MSSWKSSSIKQVPVVIFTPLGPRGAGGGIDRITNNLLAEGDRGRPTRLSALTTRGQSLARSPLHMGLAIFHIVWKQRANGIQLAHFNVSQHGSVTRKALLAKLCHRLGIPYVIHIHGSTFHKYAAGLTGRKLRRLKTFLYRAESLIVLGQVWKDRVLQILPEISSKIVVVPNSSQERRTSPARADKVPQVLFLGRVGDRKGAYDLIHALGLLPRTLEYRAIIAGDGDLKKATGLIQKLDLAERVRVVGWVGAEQVDDLLQSSAILALPSYDENLPMSVIEAFSAGLAVIATPVGAVSDILSDGQNGILVQPGDVEALGRALDRLIQDVSLRLKLGDAAREFHQNNLNQATYRAALDEIWCASVMGQKNIQ